jgi:hypothetical protein
MEADPLLKLHLSRLPKIEYLRIFMNLYGARTGRLAKTLLVPSAKLLLFLSAVFLVLFSLDFFIPKGSFTREVLSQYTPMSNFDYLFFNIFLLLAMLGLFFSFKKMATIVHNAMVVGEYEKSTVVERTVDGFLRRAESMETPTLDFAFFNRGRNVFFMVMLLTLAPALWLGGLEAVKEAAVQTVIDQPGYDEVKTQYLETINKKLELNNLGDALNAVLKEVNDSLARVGEKQGEVRS